MISRRCVLFHVFLIDLVSKSDLFRAFPKMHPIDPSSSAPFVAEALKALRKEVGPETAVLGFVGCPYTLATYMVEGKTSKEYIEIKKMAFNEPKLLHAILQNLADSIGDYALYQIENGAQLLQIFDSWAGHLSPRDYAEFASPYQKQILDKVSYRINQWKETSIVAYAFLTFSMHEISNERSKSTTLMSQPLSTSNILVL
jgi:uroporphyrinogen decarboxylase